MEIRSATVHDVPAMLPLVEKICALHKQLDQARYGFIDDVAERYRYWLTQRAVDPSSVVLVAEQQGALVAILLATTEKEIPIYKLQQFGFIHDLWVEETYRHEGIARQMVTLAMERFRQMGLTQVRLDTAIGNDAAKDLFRSCGFRACNLEMLLELNP